MESSGHTRPARSKQRKLKVFPLVQNELVVLGFDSDPAMQPHRLNAKILMGFLILGSSSACIFEYTFCEANSFAEYTESSYMGSYMLTIAFALLILVLKRKEIFALINDCECVINTTLKYSESKSIFRKANHLAEKLNKILMFVLVILTPACGALPWIIYTYSMYFTTDLGPNAFQIPIPMWLPFDWRNPIGFLAAGAVEYAMFSYAIWIGACYALIIVEFFLYSMAMAKCIKQNLSRINRYDATEKQSELLEQFIEFIGFYSRVKHIFNIFADIFQHILMITFAWSLVTISVAMLMIQIEFVEYNIVTLHHNDNLGVMLLTALQSFYSFGLMFAACELCQHAALAFEHCIDMIEQLEWYSFPLKIQKLLPSIIQFTQQPIELRCFGGAACDRELFKYVIKTAYSYFTILRNKF